MKRAVGYVRVSSKAQAEKGESLTTQRDGIKRYIEAHEWTLVEIFADEGISGGSVKRRPDLQRLLSEAREKSFDVVVIHRLSRLGRSARDLLNIVNELNECGVKLCSIKDQVDFSTPYGRAMFTMLSGIAELEREIIGEQSLENRVALAKKNIPAAGRTPFGRIYDKETGEWSLDEEKVEAIRWAADEYLDGKSLLDISEILRTRYGLPLGYTNLITVLTERCGDEWVVKFKGKEPITFNVPRILDEGKIRAVKDRLALNRWSNRRDVKKYALKGFIRCGKCGRALYGQTQQDKYTYYLHPWRRDCPCKAFTSLPCHLIENAVFKTLFENAWDDPGFQEAVKDSMPDERQIQSLEEAVKKKEKGLRKIERRLEKLVDLAVEGTLRKETIKRQEEGLYKARRQIIGEIESDKRRLASMPTIEQFEWEVRMMKSHFQAYFGSEERLKEMSYEEKRRFLHWLFDGKDEHGVPYGVYVEKNGNDKWDYFISARFFCGLRTFKGNNIDYTDEDMLNKEIPWPWEIDFYKTNSVSTERPESEIQQPFGKSRIE